MNPSPKSSMDVETDVWHKHTGGTIFCVLVLLSDFK